jgi:LysM repeat protein
MATYTIRTGDTLGGVASRFGTSVPAILSVNPQIRNANVVYAGQVINLPGVPSNVPPPPPPPASSNRTVTVRSGDTLGEIAARNGVSLQALLAANPSIRNANQISVGQQITIPGGGNPGGNWSPPPPPPPPPPPAPSGQRTYTVRAGDTMGAIAARNGVSLQALLAANPQVANPSLINVGQVLNLPGGSSSGGGTSPAVPPPPPVAPGSGGWPNSGLPALGSGARLGTDDFTRAAQTLNAEVAAVRAVAEVEAGGAGFFASGKPKILFEAHVFSNQTGGRFNASHPNISAPRWDRSLYGPSGEHQYNRLATAQSLNHQGALKSASWGMFQIMGFNHRAAGYGSVTAFVEAMFQNEGKHLDALVSFLQSNGLDRALREKRWADFARGYNGSGYAQNQYDTKLEAAYNRHRGR